MARGWRRSRRTARRCPCARRGPPDTSRRPRRALVRALQRRHTSSRTVPCRSAAQAPRARPRSRRRRPPGGCGCDGRRWPPRATVTAAPRLGRQCAVDHNALHRRAREQGVNLLVYLIVRALFQPFFHIYFRMTRIGREHIPKTGPVIVAANHRSFLDPFVIGTMARRPMYYVATEELFRRRWLAWILNALGAFPVRRGMGDEDTIKTA